MMKLYCVTRGDRVTAEQMFRAECFVSRETLDSYLIWCRQIG